MYSVTNALLVNDDKKCKIISFMFLYLFYMSAFLCILSPFVAPFTDMD